MTRNTRGFTLLEILIAMMILVVGATSVLSIFVAAVSLHSQRQEENRVVQLYDHAKQHAALVFHNFDPRKAADEGRKTPPAIDADLRDRDAAQQSTDPMIREAAEKFAGYRYRVDFEENPAAIGGSSVVAHITIWRRSGEKDTSATINKEFLTRSGTPIHEFYGSPSLDRVRGTREQERRRR